MMIYSWVVLSLWWPVVVGVALVYFVYAARQEEATMLDALPKEYSEYQQRTKMIIPFVL